MTELNFEVCSHKWKVFICHGELELYIRTCKHLTFRFWVCLLKFNIEQLKADHWMSANITASHFVVIHVELSINLKQKFEMHGGKYLRFTNVCFKTRCNKQNYPRSFTQICRKSGVLFFCSKTGFLGNLQTVRPLSLLLRSCHWTSFQG